MIKQTSRLFAALVLLIGFNLTDAAFAEATAADEDKRPPDIRLLIDISGSMKANDPENLRRPALELLVQLFPDDAKAGVWTFAQWVNMLVPHKPVSAEWRKGALLKAEKINSVGLQTNIPLAIEKALDDIDYMNGKYKTNLILLTDGMVDVSKDPAENEKARDHLINTLLPKLRAAGITIHSIALSKNADQELMERLAIETNGLSAVAETADDLTDIFLQAFDAVAPAEQVPLEDNKFLVDSSVEEFTALIFRKDINQQATLIGPDEKEYRYNSKAQDVKWFRQKNYDLITVKRPFEGEWKIVADLEPNSRVTIVSNLSLKVNRLPKTLFIGSEVAINATLKEEGQTITNQDLLSLISAEIEVRRESDDKRWQLPLPVGVSELDVGTFEYQLDMLKQAGVYDIYVRIDGKSFAREQRQRLEVREGFDIQIKASDDTPTNYQLSLFARNPEVNSQSTQVLARVKLPTGNTKLLNTALSGERTWQLDLEGVNQSGHYTVTFEASGDYDSGGRFEYTSESINVEHLVPGSEMIQPEPEPKPLPELEAKSEPIVQSEPKPESKPEVKAPVQQPEPEEEGDKLLLYGAIGFGNLFLLALCYFAYRMIKGGAASDVLEESDEDEQEEQEPPSEQREIAPEPEEAGSELEDEPEVKDEPEVVEPEEPQGDALDLNDPADIAEETGEDTAETAEEETLDLDTDELDLDVDDDMDEDPVPEEPVPEEKKEKPASDVLLDLPDDAIDIDPAADDDD
jgi:hypothetical protein